MDLTQNQTKDYIDSGLFQFQTISHQAFLKFQSPNLRAKISVSTKQFPTKPSTSIEKGKYSEILI